MAASSTSPSSPRSYLQHPYKRPGIGRIENLEAATLADVVAFHERHYRPDNATLVVTGDFDPPQLDAWVDKYFSAIPRPVEPLPQLDASEPPWTSDRAVKVTAPQVPLPAVALTWLAPPVTSTDAPALQVAAAVLASRRVVAPQSGARLSPAGGDASRLQCRSAQSDPGC